MPTVYSLFTHLLLLVPVDIRNFHQACPWVLVFTLGPWTVSTRPPSGPRTPDGVRNVGVGPNLELSNPARMNKADMLFNYPVSAFFFFFFFFALFLVH